MNSSAKLVTAAVGDDGQVRFRHGEYLQERGWSTFCGMVCTFTLTRGVWRMFSTRRLACRPLRRRSVCTSGRRNRGSTIIISCRSPETVIAGGGCSRGGLLFRRRVFGRPRCMLQESPMKLFRLSRRSGTDSKRRVPIWARSLRGLRRL